MARVPLGESRRRVEGGRGRGRTIVYPAWQRRAIRTPVLAPPEHERVVDETYVEEEDPEEPNHISISSDTIHSETGSSPTVISISSDTAESALSPFTEYFNMNIATPETEDLGPEWAMETIATLVEEAQESPQNGYTRGITEGLDGHIEEFFRLVTTPASPEPTCDICGHQGHEYQNCLFYVPHGFRVPICTNCQEMGHYYFVCPDPSTSCTTRTRSTHRATRRGSASGQTNAHGRDCLCQRCRYANPWP
ncbi:unnamed protein product [Cochlearia groenlandica]